MSPVGSSSEQQISMNPEDIARLLSQSSPSEFYLNIRQVVIVTTEDNIRLCLSNHLSKVEKKWLWIAPFGICVTIVAALVTTTFKDIGLDAAVWKALFILAGIVTGGGALWLLQQGRESVGIEGIIRQLKKERVVIATEPKNVSGTDIDVSPPPTHGGYV